MMIVDLRSPLERRVASDPQCPPRPWQRPAAWLADRLVARRVGGREAPGTHWLVVSVGNLRVGGTGKTPVVLQLARELAERGLPGAVVTRGYRAPDATPRMVTPDDTGAGDEARLLAGHLTATGWTVVQAADRRRGLSLLAGQLPPGGVVILEDAHQTARVGRHLDCVILDRWTVEGDTLRPGAGPVLPLGAYRESARGAERAAIWLVEGEVPAGIRGDGGQAVVAFRRRSLVPALPDEARVGLLCGLARPEQFEAGVEAQLAAAIPVAVRLSDHADYDAAVLRRLADLVRVHGVTHWLTTEKDHVKLAARWPHAQPLLAVGLAISWQTTPTLSELVAERRRELSGLTAPRGD